MIGIISRWKASSGRSTKWTQSHPTKNNKKKIINNISLN
jgi:hypothetical protein